MPVVFEVAPVTQHANLSDTNYATFYCRAVTAWDTSWVINTAIVDSRNYSKNGYTFSEVKVEVRQNGVLVHLVHMYLDVPTTAAYNGTEIQCAVALDGLHFSEPATLIIQGK